MNPLLVQRLLTEMISEGLGFDLSDPNLSETPKRMAKMYCEEFFSSVGREFKDFKSFPNKEEYDQIILEDMVSFVSVCSHHFLPFTGNAWLLYIPDKFLIGSSKPARLIEHYSKRPQLQERLGHEIVRAFDKGIKPLGTMLIMRAIHGCMKCRGIRKSGGMVTSVVSGDFKTYPELELKGIELIKLSLMDNQK